MEAGNHLVNSVIQKSQTIKELFLRKSILCGCLFGLLLIVLTGCAEVKTLPPLDKKMSAEESAILIIPADVKIKRINGEKRGWFKSWGVGPWSNSKAATLSMPIGVHTIKFEYSQPLYGLSSKNIEYVVTLDTENIYMLSVMLNKKMEVGTFFSAINIATSFVRDQIIGIIPFIDILPRQNLEDMSYQINEIDRETFNQYLLKESIRKKPWGIILLGFIVGGAWYFIIHFLRHSCYWFFMGKFINRHTVTAFILCIGLVMAGIIILNYNSNGILYLYLLATVLIGIGISGWDLGGKDNQRGLRMLKNESYQPSGNTATDFEELVEELSSRSSKEKNPYGISYFDRAISVAKYNATYRNNRGYAYLLKGEYDRAIEDLNKAIQLKPKFAMAYNNRGIAHFRLQNWEKAIADLSKANQLKPNNVLFKKNLVEMQAQAKISK